MSVRERIDQYSPKKSTLAWSFIGGVAATLLVGFVGLGWTTAGSAEEMAADRAETARAELATALCVQNFTAAPDLRARLIELQEIRSFQQDNHLADAGWVTFADTDTPNDLAATNCAAILADMDLPATAEVVIPADDEPIEN